MPTFVYMTSCDGCGHCVDICPSDIMHIDKTYRRAYNIEPNFCWECYSCVKACPQNAIDARGYADFAPLGHSVRALREEDKGTISWKVKFRDGREKDFVSPIRTTPWGSIKSPSDYDAQQGRSEVPRTRPRAGCPQYRRRAAGIAPGPAQAGSGLMGLFSRRKTVLWIRISWSSAAAWPAAAPPTNPAIGDVTSRSSASRRRISSARGAVAQGLYAINCYMGMQWDENQPEDHVRYARNDLMGLVREDLGYDIARHVDSTVHKFEEWGLPIMRDPETGRYQREGKWQIMIHGESYKPIVAEAARKAATEVYNRIMVTHLLMDKTKANRVAGASASMSAPAISTSSAAKAVIVCAGGASHIFKPRAVGEGMGRTWYAPWSSASAYALPIRVGAKMTQMENRIVLTRFKDGYGPVGAYFLHLKTYTENVLRRGIRIHLVRAHQEPGRRLYRPAPVPTCLRNHAILKRSRRPAAARSAWSPRKPSRTRTRRPSAGRTSSA